MLTNADPCWQVPTGRRSEFNTRKFMLLQVASIVGPVIALVIFHQVSVFEINPGV